MAVLRLVAVIIAIEALFYVLITLYLRSLRREALEKRWDRDHPDNAGDSPLRRRFVERAMTGFQKTLRARLVGLVLILPVVAVLVIMYLVNNR